MGSPSGHQDRSARPDTIGVPAHGMAPLHRSRPRRPGLTPVSATRPPAAPPAPRRRGLRALVAATAVSSVGDGAFIAAAPLAAAVVTRNPTAVAIVTAAEYLPWVLV